MRCQLILSRHRTRHNPQRPPGGCSPGWRHFADQSVFSSRKSKSRLATSPARSTNLLLINNHATARAALTHRPLSASHTPRLDLPTSAPSSVPTRSHRLCFPFLNLPPPPLPTHLALLLNRFTDSFLSQWKYILREGAKWEGRARRADLETWAGTAARRRSDGEPSARPPGGRDFLEE